MTHKLRVDEELQSLIPPLSGEEFRQLEENIISEGCRDDIVIWWPKAHNDPDCYIDGMEGPGPHCALECQEDERGEWHQCRTCEHIPDDEEFVILDGHNRYKICSEHDIPFGTQVLHIESREDAMDWMDRNQLGRRNLSPDNASLLRGRIYNRRKKAPGFQSAGPGRGKTLDQNDPVLSTAETIAKETGVSAPTVKRDGKFAETVETLKTHVPDIEKRVASGEIKRRDVLEAAKNPETAKETLSHNHRAQGTGQNEWYTPIEYINAAREVLGQIDVDPASSDKAQETIQARKYFTIDDDGLDKKWLGKVWLNPPYAQPYITKFVEKLCLSSRRGVTEAILLTHNYTDTRWFQMAARNCQAICFTRGRISFLDPDGNKAAPTQGQAFFYFGDNAERFVDEFSKFGFVVEVKAFDDNQGSQ